MKSIGQRFKGKIKMSISNGRAVLVKTKKALLRDKIPDIGTFKSTNDAFKFLAKALNSSKSSEQEIPVIKKREDLNYSFSTAGTSIDNTITLEHGLGLIPSRFYVSDLVINFGLLTAAQYSVVRLSWNARTVTFRFYIKNGSSFEGNLKITIEE